MCAAACSAVRPCDAARQRLRPDSTTCRTLRMWAAVSSAAMLPAWTASCEAHRTVLAFSSSTVPCRGRCQFAASVTCCTAYQDSWATVWLEARALILSRPLHCTPRLARLHHLDYLPWYCPSFLTLTGLPPESEPEELGEVNTARYTGRAVAPVVPPPSPPLVILWPWSYSLAMPEWCCRYANQIAISAQSGAQRAVQSTPRAGKLALRRALGQQDTTSIHSIQYMIQGTIGSSRLGFGPRLIVNTPGRRDLTSGGSATHWN